MKTRARIEVWLVAEDGERGPTMVNVEFDVEEYTHHDQSRTTGEVGDDGRLVLECRQTFAVNGKWTVVR